MKCPRHAPLLLTPGPSLSRSCGSQSPGYNGDNGYVLSGANQMFPQQQSGDKHLRCCQAGTDSSTVTLLTSLDTMIQLCYYNVVTQLLLQSAACCHGSLAAGCIDAEKYRN